MSLVHGNRLLRARISSADKLRTLRAAPATKDQLRQLNVQPALISSDIPSNTDLLERYLSDDDDFQETETPIVSLTGQSLMNPHRTATPTPATSRSGQQTVRGPPPADDRFDSSPRKKRRK